MSKRKGSLVGWLGTLSASICALLFIAFLKGDPLPNANFLFSKITDGIPKVLTLLSMALFSKVAIFIYGIVAGVYISKLSRNKSPNVSGVEISRMSPSNMDNLAEGLEQLIDDLTYAAQHGRYSMTIHEQNQCKIFYESVFEELKRVGLLDQSEPPFNEVMKKFFDPTIDYLSKVSIYLKARKFEKAKKVNFPFL